MSSVSQHLLKDPTDPGAPDVAEVHDGTALSVGVLEDLVRSNDIDIVGLTGHINDVRGLAGPASLSDVLRAHPAQQGLATVIGLMFLATNHAQRREGASEIVTWRELDGKDYAARVPTFFFLADVPGEGVRGLRPMIRRACGHRGSRGLCQGEASSMSSAGTKIPW